MPAETFRSYRIAATMDDAFCKSGFKTKKQLAEKVHCDKETVYRVMHGFVPKCIYRFVLVCAALGLDPMKVLAAGAQEFNATIKEDE